MTYITYKEKTFRPASREMIQQANQIIDAYICDGFSLTLRQLYYQFVARDLFPDSWRNAAGTTNNPQSYQKLGALINGARLAGLVSWLAIEDRTRNIVKQPHWNDPAEIIEASAEQYRIDKWRDQKHRVEVWVEKEALAGVIEPVCKELDVSFLACRGYVSQSEMWGASKRLSAQGQDPVVIHLGDHDPSGIDMTRDIDDRLYMFGGTMTIDRIALNFDQVEQYEPPPNPAKMTDSRFASYAAQYGDESWELDALEPKVLAQLIRDAVAKYRDDEKYAEQLIREKEQRDKLGAIAQDILDEYK